jgi:hypothetical protein
MPWWSKNSARKRAGKLHIWAGSADHTAAACGTISRSMNMRENAWSSSHCPSETRLRSYRALNSSRAARLKRTRSLTMR